MSNAVKFILAVLVLGILYPPLFGFVFGTIVVLGSAFVVSKILGA